MKILLRTRLLFQLCYILCILLVIGSAGSLETGVIGVRQFTAQVCAFSLLGLACRRLSRTRPRKRRRARREAGMAGARRQARAAHAA